MGVVVHALVIATDNLSDDAGRAGRSLDNFMRQYMAGNSGQGVLQGSALGLQVLLAGAGIPARSARTVAEQVLIVCRGEEAAQQGVRNDVLDGQYHGKSQ